MQHWWSFFFSFLTKIRIVSRKNWTSPYTRAISLPNARFGGIRQRYHVHLARFLCWQLTSATQCALWQIVGSAARKLMQHSFSSCRAGDSVQCYLADVTFGRRILQLLANGVSNDSNRFQGNLYLNWHLDTLSECMGAFILLPFFCIQHRFWLWKMHKKTLNWKERPIKRRFLFFLLH